MSQGPPPTRLVALSDIQHLEVGEKIRFLGCVARYSVATGTLYLEHAYPLGFKNNIAVDVQLLLSTLKSTDTRIGEWVNVMGYITSKGSMNASRDTSASIQAIVLWSAGSIKLDQYERILADQST